MSTPTGRLKVLSIVGAGRSGTTVLASILGEVEGFASAGELRWLWERGVVEERPCGCGQVPADCEVWGPVIERTLGTTNGGGDRPAVTDVIAAQREVGGRRQLPRVLRTLGNDHDWESLRLVSAAMRDACVAFADVTGARIVVDTSKRPVDAAVLAGVPDLDHYVLHIVRDPRAVVHSWRRAKTFTAGGATRTMGTRGLQSTVRRWLGNCLSAEALRRRLPESRWMHLTYEDFAERPRWAVDAIVSFLGEGADLPFVDDHSVRLAPNHIVAGNPSRFTTGTVTIRPDDEWTRALPRRDQRLVAAATLPFLKRYGYRLRTPGSARVESST